MQGCTLVVMAAGMGSRYGGIKQLEPIGPSGEIIMDYSIYDACKAGFSKVVFIIRKEIEQDFRDIIGDRISKIIDVEYVFQELDDIPEDFAVPEGRTKPWGTGQAILCCKDVIEGPFAVINADDYYGKDAFHKVQEYLTSHSFSEEEFRYCMAGFLLKNTLSDHGAVTRGVCRVDNDGILLKVDETSGITKSENGAVIYKEGQPIAIDVDQPVSMNMWGFAPNIFTILEQSFYQFLLDKGQEMTSEYLIPIIIDELIRENKVKVQVLKTNDSWFGITYKEDKNIVSESILSLVKQGVYPEQLFPL